MVAMHGGSEETASVENEAVNKPALNNAESSMDVEMVVVPGGSAVPVPAIGGEETEPLCDLNLSIAGSFMSTSDEETEKTPKCSGDALPTIESLFGSGSSDNASGEDMVVMMNEGSAVAVPAVEIEAPCLLTLNIGGSTMEDNEALHELVIIPGDSAVPSIEDASMTLNCGESTIEVKTNEAEMQIVPVPVENEAIHQLALHCDESIMEDKTYQTRMQIVLAGSTFPVPIDEGSSVIGESTMEQKAIDAGMQIVLAGSTSDVIRDSIMQEKTIETGMEIVLAGTTLPVPIEATAALQIEYVPSGSNPVAVTAAMLPKRKRGRPRKVLESPHVDTASGGIPSKSSQSPATQKRKVGRPPGTGKLQKLAAEGVSLENFAPHRLLVQKGEDVIVKLNEFLRIVHGVVCVISAAGPVSSVYIRSDTSFDGVIRYEGRFDLLGMSGSHEFDKRTSCISGSLSATLRSPSTQVFGGVLAGVLIASGLVDVFVGFFKSNEQYIKYHSNRSTSQLSKTPLVELSDESSDDDDDDDYDGYDD